MLISVVLILGTANSKLTPRALSSFYRNRVRRMRRTHRNDNVEWRISRHGAEVIHQLLESGPTLGINHPTCQSDMRDIHRQEIHPWW